MENAKDVLPVAFAKAADTVLSSSAFKRSWCSWFRCPHCGAATYRSMSRSVVPRGSRYETIEYKCDACSELAALRHPRLMNVGLPLGIAAGAFTAFYILVPDDVTWYSPTALLLNAVMICLELAATLGISRMMKRFEKCRREQS